MPFLSFRYIFINDRNFAIVVSKQYRYSKMRTFPATFVVNKNSKIIYYIYYLYY
jgi:hypothetical protein